MKNSFESIFIVGYDYSGHRPNRLYDEVTQCFFPIIERSIYDRSNLLSISNKYLICEKQIVNYNFEHWLILKDWRRLLAPIRFLMT